jgi:hypothetical protein
MVAAIYKNIAESKKTGVSKKILFLIPVLIIKLLSHRSRFFRRAVREAVYIIGYGQPSLQAFLTTIKYPGIRKYKRKMSLIIEQINGAFNLFRRFIKKIFLL